MLLITITQYGFYEGSNTKKLYTNDHTLAKLRNYLAPQFISEVGRLMTLNQLIEVLLEEQYIDDKMYNGEGSLEITIESIESID